MDAKKVYIGDGIYVSNDGWHVVLETERENGQNLIYLEPQMLTELMDYAIKVGFRLEIPDALK